MRVLAAVCAAGCPAAPPGGDEEAYPADRLVHFFDFDERDEGNLEMVPKFWMRFGGEGFPHYVSGQFDFQTGHRSPPSFQLECQGRNVAYRYTGFDTRVEPGSDFLVAGWIRGSGLANARAALSAYYLDHRRLPLAWTQRFSPLIGGDPRDDTWHRVEIFLPGGPPQARTIGLTAWLVQPAVWDEDPKPTHYIQRRDAGATVWLDDIEIFRLPGVRLQASDPGGVFPAGEGGAFLVTITDEDVGGMEAVFNIRDMEARSARRVPIPVRPRGSEPVVIGVDDLEAGLYSATLGVRASGLSLAERTLQFAVTPHMTVPLQRASSVRGDFGVVLSARNRGEPASESALLKALGVGAVKVPVWSGVGNVPDLVDGPVETSEMVYGLVRSGVRLTAVLAGPPSKLARASGAFPEPLLELLSSDPGRWSADLQRVVASNANVFASWQIGSDGEDWVPTDGRLAVALNQVRREMEVLSTSARLSVPFPLTWEPVEPALEADEVCLAADPSILPRYIPDHLGEQRRGGYGTPSLFIKEAPTGGMDRRSRLRNWCRRLVYAHYAGFSTVFVPQPWRTRPTPWGAVTEPEEEYVLLHTLVQLLGGTTPGVSTQISEGVTCLAFDAGDKSVLVLWDDLAGPQGRNHQIQLGSGTTQYDMWGRARTLLMDDDGRQLVQLTPEPSFVPGVERWLIAFRALISLTPPRVTFSLASHEHALQLTNPHREQVSGRVRLLPPDDWRVNPRQFEFSLPPGGQLSKPLEIHLGGGETAGPRIVQAEVELDTPDNYRLAVPLPLELGLEDIEAWGYAFTEGRRLVVRHGVTNRSDQTINLRSFAIAPGRLRQYRLLTGLEPGETRTVEYRFSEGDALGGRSIRLQLREISGPRSHNIAVDVQ